MPAEKGKGAAKQVAAPAGVKGPPYFDEEEIKEVGTASFLAIKYGNGS